MAVTALRSFYDREDRLIHYAVRLQTYEENPSASPRYACDYSTTVSVRALNDKRSTNLAPTCVWCAAGRQWWR